MGCDMRRALYIASTLDNKERVGQLIQIFRAVGIDVTYDWTEHGRVFNQEELQLIGLRELQGVRDASVILLVTPAGHGSHFEAGAGYISGKPLVILYEEPLAKPTSFHHLPGVRRCSDVDQAIALVIDSLEGRL